MHGIEGRKKKRCFRCAMAVKQELGRVERPDGKGLITQAARRHPTNERARTDSPANGVLCISPSPSTSSLHCQIDACAHRKSQTDGQGDGDCQCRTRWRPSGTLNATVKADMREESLNGSKPSMTAQMRSHLPHPALFRFTCPPISLFPYFPLPFFSHRKIHQLSFFLGVFVYTN